MKKIQLFTLLFFVLIIPHKGFSALLQVPASYGSIQSAIDASTDGDTVLVDPGTYYEHINLGGKSILLCSKYITTGNSADITGTIIDGGGSGRVITINQWENTSCMIIGFTIRNGNSSSESEPFGGGLYISDASPQILRCVIQNNYSPTEGGGICIRGMSTEAKVSYCTIINNTSDGAGGGVRMADCNANAEVANCIISGNTNNVYGDFNGGGGGVNIAHSGKLVNCLVTNNSVPNASVGGGGVYCDWGDYNGSQGIFVTGCTIVNNTGLNWGGTNYVVNGGEFRNCIIWGNIDQWGYTANYNGSIYNNCCSDPLPAGTGNKSANPVFVNPSSDFRLASGSPCIDAGNNIYNTEPLDLDGNLRISNIIDMGAYEKTTASNTTVQVGAGTGSYDQFPIYSYYGYSYSQQIYLGSEITSGGGAAGSISKIRFYYAGGGSDFTKWNNWDVYLGNTTKTDFANSADWIPVAALKPVFSGIIPDPVAGTWIELTLSTPFYYSGNNIVVAVDENTPDWDYPPAQWGSFDSGSARGLMVFDDNNNPDPASPPDANSGPDNTIAQVRFDIVPGQGSLEGHITEMPGCTTPVEGAIVTLGSYSATTDASGLYRLPLPMGTYLDVTAHHGDVTQTFSPVIITAGNTTTQDFCLNPYFAPPVNLQASISGTSANNVHLTWMAPGSVPDQWIHWDNGISYGGLGYNGPYVFSVASRWPVADIAPYNGKYLKKIRFIITEPTATYTLKVWKGANASTLLLSQVISNPFINSWNEVTLTTPILIDGTEEFWFGYEINQTSGYPAGLGQGPAVAGKGDMINGGGGWFSVKQVWGWEFNWLLQGFVSASPVMAPQQLTPMVQNTASLPDINSHQDVSAKPMIMKAALESNVQLPSPDASENNQGTIRQNSPAPSAPVIPTGYNVYKDNVLIADNIPDLFYNDASLPKGGYEYEVSALYDLGESARIGPVHVDIYTCFPPTGLTVSNTTLTTTTANVTWTPSLISTNTQWNIEWGVSGFSLGSGNTALVSGTPGYSLTNLVPGTEYDVYVRTYCSSTDASAWVKKTFRTHFFNCPQNATAESEVCGNATNNGCDAALPAFENITCGETVCGTSWLHRSHRDSDWYSFTLTGTRDVTLNSGSEFNYIIGIKSSPCPSADFIVSQNFSQYYSIPIWTQLSAGTYYVYIAPNYNDQIACDSLSRYWFSFSCSTCLTPTALNVTNITESSARLLWTSGTGSWDIEWGRAGFVEGSGTIISGTSQNPYTLTGLTAGYSYNFYVRSSCGSGNYSYWAGPYTFFLPCSSTGLPYNEDFTMTIGYTPECWQVKNYGGPTNWIVNMNNYAGGAFPQLEFIPNNPNFSGRSFVTSPLINTTGLIGLDLSFKQYINSYSSGTACEIWTTQNGGTTWSSVWSSSQSGILGPGTTNITIANADVGSPTFQFAFAVNGNSWDIGTWQIDDISLTAAKTLSLKLYIQGLYAGAGTMNPAYDENGLHWPDGIADHITVELHDGSNYSNVVYTANDVNLGTNGLAKVAIPGTNSGSYYVTLRHRNGIQTVTASPVSFTAGTISYDLSDNPSKAYGDNLLQMIDGKYVLYSGDVNQDDLIDGSDLSVIDNLATLFTGGYLPEDVNGDGLVDGSDLSIVDNNANNFVGVVLP